MKCDELQYERLGDANKTYPASTLVIRKQYVDEATTELIDKIQQKDFFWEGCSFSKMGFKNTIDVANYVEEQRADNEKLKEALKIKDDLLIENGAEIGSLKADNESLRKAVSNWHDKYCNLQETIDRLECKLECVKENKDKELRATNRALWLARAEKNELLSNYRELDNYMYGLMVAGKRSHYEDYENHADSYNEWTAKLSNAAQVCRAKAEEYK